MEKEKEDLVKFFFYLVYSLCENDFQKDDSCYNGMWRICVTQLSGFSALFGRFSHFSKKVNH